MKRLAIPYGKKRLQIEVAEDNILDIIQPKGTDQANTREILTQALNQPVGDRSLRHFLSTIEDVLFIVNDATRPTKTAAVLDLVHDHITKQTRFLVATGAHRTPCASELDTMFARHYRQYKDQILIHDAKNDTMLCNIGKTRYGNELWLNKHVTTADRIVVIGSVEPHYFAGFTGGRKSLLPGVAGYSTIEQNHRFALHAEAKALNLTGNPIHEEMLDCVKAFGPERIFSLQMVLDNNRNVLKAYTGPIDRTFEMATEYAKGFFSASIPIRADVVVTVSQPPFDIDLYQTLKAIENGRLAMNQGGILIVVSPCSEGLGPESFARLFKDSSNIDQAVQNSKSKYRLGDQNAVNLLALTKQAQAYAITEIEGRILKNAGITPHHSLQDAIEEARFKKGSHVKILFLMNGSLTVPLVQNTTPC